MYLYVFIRYFRNVHALRVVTRAGLTFEPPTDTTKRNLRSSLGQLKRIFFEQKVYINYIIRGLVFNNNII